MTKRARVVRLCLLPRRRSPHARRSSRPDAFHFGLAIRNGDGIGAGSARRSVPQTAKAVADATVFGFERPRNCGYCPVGFTTLASRGAYAGAYRARAVWSRRSRFRWSCTFVSFRGGRFAYPRPAIAAGSMMLPLRRTACGHKFVECRSIW